MSMLKLKEEKKVNIERISGGHWISARENSANTCGGTVVGGRRRACEEREWNRNSDRDLGADDITP